MGDVTAQDIEIVRKLLSEKLTGTTRTIEFSEVSHVAEVGFEAAWNGQRVQIRFLDLGPDPELRNYRYNCEAWVVDERGNQVSERATGNGASSWRTALSIMQWHWLEQPLTPG